MKLKAPEGVGDPCVAGVAIVPRGGVYEVEPEIGALLIECFGFVEIKGGAPETSKNPVTTRRSKPAATKAPPKKL